MKQKLCIFLTSLWVSNAGLSPTGRVKFASMAPITGYRAAFSSGQLDCSGTQQACPYLLSIQK